MQLASDLRPWLLRDYFWSSDATGLILEVELPGTDLRVLAWLDLRARTLTRLTPGLGADARYAGQLGGPKQGVMIGVRYPQAGGYELQAVSPAGTVLAEWKGPPGRPVSRWLATAEQAVAVCEDDEGCTWWQTPLDEPAWSQILSIPAADAAGSGPLGFSADGKALFCLSTAGRDTIGLLKLGAPSWAPELLSGQDGFDVVSVLMAPDGSGPDLVRTTDPAGPQTALTPAAAADLSRLQRSSAGRATIIGRNDSHCLAEVPSAIGGPGLIMVSGASGQVSKPLPRFTGLAKVSMRQRDPFRFAARDGLMITGFLTRPVGRPPWPAVLVVHDGPWSRDGAQTDPWAQSLATAGLCCVQVNYRGSRGFGKKFARAGDQQWSLAMQDDLIDALRAEPVAELADPERIAAIGYGYGGYAALMLAAQREVPLAGAAAAAAPADLVRYVSSLMAFGGPAGYEYAARIGHPASDRERLIATSPISRAADITAPVLLFHGRQDARVPVSHATSLAESLHLLGRRCDLTIYEDEGHRFSRPQNLADMRTRTTNFLLGL
jgi:dipeptidyl aminopeptidase/acylaminoacyl peptidase